MYYLKGRGSLSRLTTVSFDDGTYTGTLDIFRTSVALTSTSKKRQQGYTVRRRDSQLLQYCRLLVSDFRRRSDDSG